MRTGQRISISAVRKEPIASIIIARKTSDVCRGKRHLVARFARRVRERKKEEKRVFSLFGVMAGDGGEIARDFVRSCYGHFYRSANRGNALCWVRYGCAIFFGLVGPAFMEGKGKLDFCIFHEGLRGKLRIFGGSRLNCRLSWKR